MASPLHAAALAACRNCAAGETLFILGRTIRRRRGAYGADASRAGAPFKIWECVREGSGAALATPIVEAACAMYHEMGMLAASNIAVARLAEKVRSGAVVP